MEDLLYFLHKLLRNRNNFVDGMFLRLKLKDFLRKRMITGEAKRSLWELQVSLGGHDEILTKVVHPNY